MLEADPTGPSLITLNHPEASPYPWLFPDLQPSLDLCPAAQLVPGQGKAAEEQVGEHDPQTETAEGAARQQLTLNSQLAHIQLTPGSQSAQAKSHSAHNWLTLNSQ